MPPTHPSQADVAAAYRTLIAHETEPKEQDFYRARLQRLEQATEPESDDFVTQLAVKQIEGEAAWWRSIDFDRNASRTFESMTGDSQQAVRTGVERVLAHLTAAGRLIPAGGMALTAEQVEDVRTVVSADAAAWNRLSPALFAAYRLRRALFPATEPAEPAIQSAGGDCFDVCEGHPAPAEPAEEKTKAEGLSNVELSCLKLICDLCKKSYKGTVWLPINDMVQGFVDRHYLTRDENDSCKPTINAEKALASSPVVPAPTESGPRYCSSCKLNVPPAPYCTNCGGDTIPRSPTETGLWQTWQEVPDDTPFWSRDKRETNSWWWITRTAEHRKELRQADACGETVHLGPTSFMNEFAPFVAAEEG